jgi:hypothetical protein
MILCEELILEGRDIHGYPKYLEQAWGQHPGRRPHAAG